MKLSSVESNERPYPIKNWDSPFSPTLNPFMPRHQTWECVWGEHRLHPGLCMSVSRTFWHVYNELWLCWCSPWWLIVCCTRHLFVAPMSNAVMVEGREPKSRIIVTHPENDRFDTHWNYITMYTLSKYKAAVLPGNGTITSWQGAEVGMNKLIEASMHR